jgi:sugar phosphate isomerase/epimerase
MFKNLSLEALGISGTQNETIELALSHGFRGIDLDLVDFAQQAAERGLPHARRLLDSAKLRIGSFAIPFSLELDDAAFAKEMSRLAELIKLAKEMNCTRAVVQISPVSDQRPFHQNFEFHRKRLIEIAGLLEPAGIRLGVGYNASPAARSEGAYQFITQYSQLQMLLGLVGRRNVGILLDVWHLHVAGGGIDEIRKLGNNQVVALRLADFPRDRDVSNCSEEDRLLPGETGVIDSAAVLTHLAEAGYDGPVTPYPSSTCFQGLRRDEIGKRAGQALDHVWKGAGLSPAGKLAVAARK